MHKSKGYEKSARFYDLFDEKENIDFFISYALEKQEALDIGAGTGRIAIPIAEEGVEVFCVEPSIEMLKYFYKKLETKTHLTNKINIIHSDASSFRLNRKFKYIFMSGVFDHLINDNERIKVLKNIRNHLASKGLFVFDLFVGLMKNSPLKPAGTVVDRDIQYKRYIGSKILKDGRIEVSLRYEIIKENIITDFVEEISSASIINVNYLIDLLESCKFTIKNVYSSYDRIAYEEGDDLLIIVVEV
jgi:SAM-dependent methyltransferase